MSVNVTLNGTTFSIPQTSETNWGSSVTAWIQAVSSHTLQKTGGSFTLTAEVDFGATYGLKSAYFKSRTANPASAGAIRLANSDSVKWRNAGNTADLALTPGVDGVLNYDGVKLLRSTEVVNADISGSAAIAYSKLNLTSGIVNADISGTAAIAYSKLALTGSIVNADISGSAAIAYSKLTLTGSVVNADISASAAIALTKLAALTADKVLVSNGSGVITPSSVTATTLGYLDATSSIQTQLNGKELTLTAGTTSQYYRGDKTWQTLDKTAVGLANVDNTSDANKPVSTSTQTALNAKADTATLTAHTGATTSVHGIADTSALATKTGAETLTNKTISTASNTIQSGAAASGQVLTANGSGGTSWATPASAPDQSYELSNLGLATSVSGNALTVALKTKTGSDPSAGDPVKIGFRSSTATSGTYNQRSVTAALSMTVSSGSTLGHQNGVASYIWVYAIDNAGTVELGVSTFKFDEGSVVSTTAEGGAGAADSATTIYSTTARSNVPVRVIGRLKSTQTNAGTWAASITEISLAPKPWDNEKVYAKYTGVPTGGFGFAVLTFPTKQLDPFGCYVSGGFVSPRAGALKVTALIEVSGTESLDNSLILRADVDGVPSGYLGAVRTPGTLTSTILSGQTLVPVNAGSVVHVKAYTTIGGASMTTSEIAPEVTFELL